MTLFPAPRTPAAARRLAPGIFLCATVVGLATPVQAGPGNDALAAGDYKRAISILEPQANRGFAEAQYLMGRMREQGLGAPVDIARARYWYNRAAAQGNKEAREALVALDGKSKSGPQPAATPATAALPAPPRPVAVPPPAAMESEAQQPDWQKR